MFHPSDGYMAKSGCLLISSKFGKYWAQVPKCLKNKRPLLGGIRKYPEDMLIQPSFSVMPYKRINGRVRIARPREQNIPCLDAILFWHGDVGICRL